MARFGMDASVSWARAMLILSSCLIFGTLIGLLPHISSRQNLRSESGQQQQQQNPTAGGSGNQMPKLPDLSPAKEAGSRALGQAGNFVWDGDYAFGAVQEHALDEVEVDFSFGFASEGSYSYDYYY